MMRKAPMAATTEAHRPHHHPSSFLPAHPQARSAPVRLRIGLMIALWCLLGGMSAVQAHPFLQNSWWVVVETNRLVMRVSTTLREVAVAQRLGDATNLVAMERLMDALSNHGETLMESLQVEADGNALAGEVLDFRLLGDGADEAPPDSPLFLDQSHASYDLEYRLPEGPPPSELRFGHRMLGGFVYAPGIPWEVTYALLVKDADRRDLGAGLVRSDLPYSLDIHPTYLPLPQSTEAGHPRPLDSLERFDPTTSRPSFLSYLRLGVWHILTGYDHLLFLAALALAAVTIQDFLKLILTFTAAHSITVTLSAMNIVRLPPWFVEPFIAATIIYVAVENVVLPRRVSTPSRLAVAFGFGLVHGLGFARGLNDSLGGAGGTALGLAILAFCLGVELGHLAVGLPFWGCLRTGRAAWGIRFSQSALRYGSISVAMGGVYFFIAALRQYF